MDPNAALNSILHGHLIADHAEALHDWLRGDGFSPDPVLLPVDCDPRFSDMFTNTDDISATTQGLEQNGELIFSWRELENLADFNDAYKPFDKV